MSYNGRRVPTGFQSSGSYAHQMRVVMMVMRVPIRNVLPGRRNARIHRRRGGAGRAGSSTCHGQLILGTRRTRPLPNSGRFESIRRNLQVGQ